ncbi:MAG: hypothetical protein LPJ89_05915 [Hymenobacteraceae bacterium]|nr:hypothetical protein [Hymenobacteraceae bacterium]MDX5397425.1 hypothetical protein [Hymenobacteraceae bacterium]MDX5443306.1 hypothetical protein [Hymenobacteraceae bacterium]MDX5513503.1 hypothetical protein [Hymenobacteraceae bacterium]
MSVKNYFLLLCVLLIAGFAAQAQEQPVYQEDEPLEYATPSVLGQGKSKGVRIRYEVIPHFDISSDGKAQGVADAEGEIRRNNKFELKLFAPIFNRPKFKMVVGFHHEFEEFNFVRNDPLTYDFYKNLEDKNLKSIGGQIVMLRPLDEVNFIVFRVKSELNGDYTNARLRFGDYLKTSVEGVYGWKKSPYLTYGIAVQLGYTYGRRSIYPAILFNKTYNEKWGIEALFPANLMVRRNFSERSLFFFGYELDGASYNINI